MFEPIKNPYIVGNPIKGTKMFFGREDDFAYVKTKFTASTDGGLIVLCGARRSGKTSILFQIEDGRLGEDFVPVLIDMQSMAISDDADFLRKISELILEAFPDARSLDVDSRVKKRTPFALFEAFIAGIEERLGEKRLLLALDEYELIETQIDSGVLTEQLLHLFAGLIEHHRLYVLFTGSDHLEARNKRYWDVFLSKALYRRVSFLSYGDTMRLITEPIDGLVEYAEGVPERIAAATAGQPFYTQVVCQSVVDHLNDMRKRDVNEEDLAAVLEDVIENPLPQMIFHWNAYSPAEKLVLAIVADLARGGALNVNADAIHKFAEEEKIGYRFDPQALNKLLETLFHGDMLIKAAEGDVYSYKMGLWQRWVGRMHSTWQVLDEIEKEEADLEDSGLVRIEKKRSRLAFIIPAAGVLVAVILGFVFRGEITARLAGESQIQTMGGRTISAADAAWATFESTPNKAEVFVNDNPLGITSFTSVVASGPAVIEFRREGYRTLIDTVTFARNETTLVAYALQERTGYVNLETVPTGASVRVDGQDKGETPVKLAFHVVKTPIIELRLDGYNPHRFDPMTIYEDSTIEMAVTMSRLRGGLTIRTVPSEALVLIDRQLQQQQTPTSVQGLQYGNHELILKRNGYEDYRQDFRIPYPKDEIFVTLTRLPPGYILFKITPYATSILIDGTEVWKGTQNFVVSHAPGPVVVKMAGPPGSGGWEKELTVTSNDTTVIDHNFGR